MPTSMPYKGAEEWIYAYILSYYEDNDFPPTLGEIVSAWNATHRQQVTRGFFPRYINRLVKEHKLVERGSYYSRVWTVPDDPKALCNSLKNNATFSNGN